MIKSNYFKALFIRNMSMVILLAIIVASVTYFNGFTLEEKQLEAAHMNVLEQQSSMIDTSMSIAITSIGIFEDEQQFKNYRDDDIETPYTSVGMFQRLVKIVSPLAKFGFTLGLCKRGSDLVISTKFAADFSTYFSYMGFSDEAIIQAKNYLILPEFSEQPYYTFQSLPDEDKTEERDIALTMIYRKKYPDSDVINFFISIYKDVVLPPIDNPVNEGFTLIDNGKSVVSSTAYYGKMAEDIIAKDSLPTSRTVAYKDYMCYVRRSEIVPNWTYVYMAKKASYTAYNILFLTMFITVFFLIIGSWVAFSNSKKIYSPIHKIVNILDRSGEFEQGNDVEFIENAIISINNLNEELSHRLEDSEESFKAKAFSELLYGLMRHEDAERIVEKYNLKRYLVPLNVVVIKMVNSAQLYDHYRHDELVELNHEVMTGIGNILKSAYEYFMLFKLDYKSYAAVIPENSSINLEKTLTSMVRTIESMSDIRLLSCIGRRVESLYFAMDSFADAMFVMGNQLFGPKISVVVSEEMSRDGGYTFYYPIDMERNLLMYIENGQFDKAVILLERLLKNNLHQHQMSKEVTNEFIYSIIATIKRTLQQLNLEFTDVFEKGSILYIELKYCETPEQLANKIMDCFTAIFKKACIDDESQKSTIERILAYIRNNYDKDISLNDVSEYFELSPGYVSRLFKNEAAMTYKDYLNTYRIQQAKELMSQGSKIGDVARLVGCNSIGTFIRIFKRYEGVSPGEYMRNENEQRDM